MVDPPAWADNPDDCGVYVCRVAADLLAPTAMAATMTSSKVERERILLTLVRASENPATCFNTLAKLRETRAYRDANPFLFV